MEIIVFGFDYARRNLESHEFGISHFIDNKSDLNVHLKESKHKANV